MKDNGQVDAVVEAMRLAVFDEYGLRFSDRTMRCALAAARPIIEPQWQDIESAPKDGTVVLFFTPDEGGRFYMSRGDDRWNGAHWLERATHWMPLPAPPLDRSGE